MPTVTQEIVGKGNTKSHKNDQKERNVHLLSIRRSKKKKKAMGSFQEGTQFKMGTEAAQRCLPGRGKGSCCGGESWERIDKERQADASLN